MAKRELGSTAAKTMRRMLMPTVDGAIGWRCASNMLTSTKNGVQAAMLDCYPELEVPFDHGLAEIIKDETLTFAGGEPAYGKVVVTAKGKVALDSFPNDPLGRRTFEAVKHPSKPRAPKSAGCVAPKKTNPFNTLPKIVMVHGVNDGGDGCACPHCGAAGRWITTFTCEGGTTGACMRGCFKLWPKHRFAAISGKIMEKQRDCDKFNKKHPHGKQKVLASWDRDCLAAIGDFLDGRISEAQADTAIVAAQGKKRAYCERRYGRRS